MLSRGSAGSVLMAAAAVAFICGSSRGQTGEAIAGESGGGSGEPQVRLPHQSCISPEQRAAVQAEVQANIARLGPMSPRGPAGNYAFWPQGGTLGRDLFTNNFVDLNATTNLLDYGCGNWTYDGHNGHDIDLRSFSEQTIGVPIFAALDGTVVGRADGQPDMNTVWANQPANYVVLDHGGGHQTWYWHMKNGSVAVGLGQIVKAGQQIGLTASSGISTGPHLHFEANQSGSVYEPFAGVCRAGISGWTNQYVPDRMTTYLRDFGFTYNNLSSYGGPPTPYPRSSHLALSDTVAYYWMQGHNLPAGATFQFRFIRPNGTLSFQSTPSTPSWATGQYRWWWAWYSWNVTDMHSITGTWRVQVLINGITVIDAPVEVLAARNTSFNRAPSAVTLALDPPSPSIGDVVFCRVMNHLLLDDPDYDVVRYRFVWRVKGAVVRDVTVACLSDAIARNTMMAGGALSCAVTPSDGLLAGPTTTFYFNCRADFNLSGGDPTVLDIFSFLTAWFAQDPRANFDQVGGVAVPDIFSFLTAWFLGC